MSGKIVSKASIPIGIQPGTKLIHMQYEPASKAEPPHWVLWVHHDAQLRHGTFLRLYPDGRMERVTLGADGMEDVTRIR